MARVVENIHSDVVMSVGEAAYFAGFVDGEGSLTTTRTARTSSRSGYRYQPVFRVPQCDIEVLKWLRTTCGNGRIVTQVQRLANHRQLFALTFSPHQIRHVLPQLLPYLHVKAKTAKLLLEFLSLSNGWHLHQRAVDWQRIEAIHREIHNANPRAAKEIELEESIDIRDSRRGNNQWTKQSCESA